MQYSWNKSEIQRGVKAGVKQKYRTYMSVIHILFGGLRKVCLLEDGQSLVTLEIFRVLGGEWPGHPFSSLQV